MPAESVAEKGYQQMHRIRSWHWVPNIPNQPPVMREAHKTTLRGVTSRKHLDTDGSTVSDMSASFVLLWCLLQDYCR